MSKIGNATPESWKEIGRLFGFIVKMIKALFSLFKRK